MSRVEYIKCDGASCGRLAPCCDGVYLWGTDAPLDYAEGWAILMYGNRELHLCPDCAKKALEAVGLE